MRFLREIYSDSLFKNSVYLMVTNLFNLALGFFFWVIAARYYTPYEIGMTSAILSSMTLIAMISSLGFPTALLFYLPKEPENAGRMINSCLVASIAASLMFSIMFVSGLDIWVPSLKSVLSSSGLAAFFISVTVASNVSILISSTFIAGRKSSFHMTKETLFGFIKIFPLHAFAGFGAVGIFLSWGVGVTLAVIMGFAMLSRVWRGYFLMPAFDPVIRSMAGFSMGNYIAGILYALPRFALPVMIVDMVSPESAGFFFIAITIASLLYGIPQSISSSLLAESSSGGELWTKAGKAVKFNAELLLPGVLLFILFGEYILNLFNPSFASNATVTLIILAAASLPMSLNTIFITVRNAQKRVNASVKINAAIAALTLILSVPLMKSSGIEGAAAAYLAANTIAAVAVSFKIKNLSGFVLKSVLSRASVK
ncbi:MAG: polysaccharide biosynthesis C-terminal domain-containing protein [Candidatus Methanoperedens sp.]|nr:polysaccharide biosynthesis C-terminal domain-containing protein [Candidatus Methanoperedens sp.]